MSKESVQLIVTQTIATINNEMVALNDDVPTAAQVEGIIQTAFLHAFKQVDAGPDRENLFRMLSFKVHPDKLQMSTEFFAGKLVNNEVLKVIPLQVLGQLRTDIGLNEALFNDLQSDPMAFVQAMYKEFFLQLAKETQQYQRYGFPIAYMVSFANSYVITVIGLANISVMLAALVINGFISLIETTLLNIASDNHYDEELEKLITPKYLAENAKVLLGMVGGIVTDALETDDDIMAAFHNWAGIQAGIDVEVQDIDVFLRMLTKRWLQMVQSGARFNAINDAFADNIGLRVLFLVLDMLVQLSQLASSVAVLGVIAAGVVITVAATLLINSPLYAWDALNYLVNALVSAISQVMDKMKTYFTAEADPGLAEGQSSPLAHFSMFSTSTVAANDETHSPLPGHAFNDID